MSPPATDLSGGNTSEDSFTRLTASLVVAYAVDFQSDLLSGTAPGSTVWSNDFGVLPWSLLGTGRIWLEAVSGSVVRKKCLDELPRIESFTHAYQ